MDLLLISSSSQALNHDLNWIEETQTILLHCYFLICKSTFDSAITWSIYFVLFFPLDFLSRNIVLNI